MTTFTLQIPTAWDTVDVNAIFIEALKAASYHIAENEEPTSDVWRYQQHVLHYANKLATDHIDTKDEVSITIQTIPRESPSGIKQIDLFGNIVCIDWLTYTTIEFDPKDEQMSEFIQNYKHIIESKFKNLTTL